MGCDNGHDKQLVEEINKVWENESNRKHFGKALHSLAFLYEDEVSDLGVSVYSNNDALRNANMLLENVCDDADLRYILWYINSR